MNNADVNFYKIFLSYLQKKKQLLEAQFTFNELTSAVMDLSSGRVPGIDGLPAEFYKRFWTIIDIIFLKLLRNV